MVDVRGGYRLWHRDSAPVCTAAADKNKRNDSSSGTQLPGRRPPGGQCKPLRRRAWSAARSRPHAADGLPKHFPAPRPIPAVGRASGQRRDVVCCRDVHGSVQTLPERAKQLRAWDVEVQLAPHENSALTATNLARQIPHVTHVEAWSIIQTGIGQPGQMSVTRTYPDQGHGSMAISVIPPGSSLMQPPRLLEGRWLHRGETGAVVISQSVRAEVLPDIRSGDTVQLSIGGHLISWQVVGIAEFVFQGGSIFMTEEGFEAATGLNQPNVLRIVTDRHDEETRTAVANATERVLTQASITVR